MKLRVWKTCKLDEPILEAGFWLATAFLVFLISWVDYNNLSGASSSLLAGNGLSPRPLCRKHFGFFWSVRGVVCGSSCPFNGSPCGHGLNLPCLLYYIYRLFCLFRQGSLTLMLMCGILSTLTQHVGGGYELSFLPGNA